MDKVKRRQVLHGSSVLNDSADKKSESVTTWKVSTMVNPDGSVTIRRKTINPDGSFTVNDEVKDSESSFDEQQKSEMPTLLLSDSSDISSITEMRTQSLISPSSSKDDVFAGIDESPLRSRNSPKISENSTRQQKAGKSSSPNPLRPSLPRTPVREAAEITASTYPSPVYEWDFRKLRGAGPLADTRSVEESVERSLPKTVSVFKKHLDDRLGINVGLERIGYKDRLIVTKIAENGKFAGTGVEEGDIVTSINSHSFLRQPDSEDALAIVSTAVGKLTFVVQKRERTEDVSIASPPLIRSRKELGPDRNATTRECVAAQGSQTLVVDHFDESGNQVRREKRKEQVDPCNPELLATSDEFSSLGTDAANVNEKTVVVRKMEKLQKIGLKIELSHTSQGRFLIIAGILPSGLVAKNQGPLAVGDVVVKINGFDFLENPILEIANSIIGNCIGDVTIIATGTAESASALQEIARTTVEDDVETAFIANRTPEAAAPEFDESSYGGSIGSYISSKVLRITKSDPSDGVGFGMMTQITNWGPMLVVSEISGNKDQTELEVGDAILTINGIDFRGEPDPNRAASVLQKATNLVVVEYQRLSQMKKPLVFPPSAVMETERSGSKKTGRSRKSKRIDEFDACLSTKMTPSNTAEGSLGADARLGKQLSPDRRFQLSESAKPDQQVDQRKLGNIFVKVKKAHARQEVGISFESVNGVLFVSRISKEGPLAGGEIAPGDIVLSINNSSFKENARVRDADALVRDARMLILEVRKQNDEASNDLSQPKLKWHQKLQCKRRGEETL